MWRLFEGGAYYVGWPRCGAYSKCGACSRIYDMCLLVCVYISMCVYVYVYVCVCECVCVCVMYNCMCMCLCLCLCDV